MSKASPWQATAVALALLSGLGAATAAFAQSTAPSAQGGAVMPPGDTGSGNSNAMPATPRQQGVLQNPAQGQSNSGVAGGAAGSPRTAPEGGGGTGVTGQGVVPPGGANSSGGFATQPPGTAKP